MKDWIELLKYPVVGLTIFFVLLAVDAFLQIDLSRITKIGPGGVELAEQRRQTGEALLSIEGRLNEVVSKVSLLEEKLKQKDISLSSKEIKQVQAQAQDISKEVAILLRPSELTKETRLLGKKGYIWIGNFNSSNNKWEKSKLLTLDGKIIDYPPSNITRGEFYKVSGNMVMRDGLPPNDDQYFLARKKIGVIQPGTTVQIKTKPTAVDREFAIQYWVEVQVYD